MITAEQFAQLLDDPEWMVGWANDVNEMVRELGLDTARLGYTEARELALLILEATLESRGVNLKHLGFKSGVAQVLDACSTPPEAMN